MLTIHGKNAFVEIKIELDTDLKITSLGHQNNYVGCSNWLLKCQNVLQHVVNA